MKSSEDMQTREKAGVNTPERCYPDLEAQGVREFRRGDIIDDRYEILELIASGGIGCVYKCKELKLDRVVALKLLRDTATVSETSIIRFQREGRVLSRLSHLSILSVYRCGIAYGAPYIAMEYIPGRDLRSILTESTRLPVQKIVPLALQICDALAYAHEQGIIHRDLKPENIMVSLQDELESVKVVDFGLARMLEDPSLTATPPNPRAACGSLPYMSPEQCTGKVADARSDIYSLGCVLYEMTTGQPPFSADDPVAFLHLHGTVAPPPLSVTAPNQQFPPGFESVMVKMMQKNCQLRYQTVREVTDDLRLVQDGNGNSLECRPTVQQHRGSLLAIIGLIAVMLLSIGVAVGLATRKNTDASNFESQELKSTGLRKLEKPEKRLIPEAEVTELIRLNQDVDVSTAMDYYRQWLKLFEYSADDFSVASAHYKLNQFMQWPGLQVSNEESNYHAKLGARRFMKVVECGGVSQERYVLATEHGSEMFRNLGDWSNLEKIRRVSLAYWKDVPDAKLERLRTETDLAEALARQNRFDEAASISKRMISMFDSVPCDKASALCTAAFSHFGCGRNEEGMKYLRSAMAITEEDDRWKINLFVYYRAWIRNSKLPLAAIDLFTTTGYNYYRKYPSLKQKALGLIIDRAAGYSFHSDFKTSNEILESIDGDLQYYPILQVDAFGLRVANARERKDAVLANSMFREGLKVALQLRGPERLWLTSNLCTAMKPVTFDAVSSLTAVSIVSGVSRNACARYPDSVRYILDVAALPENRAPVASVLLRIAARFKKTGHAAEARVFEMQSARLLCFDPASKEQAHNLVINSDIALDKDMEPVARRQCIAYALTVARAMRDRHLSQLYFEHAIKSRNESDSTDRPWWDHVLSLCAGYLEETDRGDEALRMCRAAIAEIQGRDEVNQFAVAKFRLRIASILHSRGNDSEARVLINQVAGQVYKLDNESRAEATALALRLKGAAKS